MARNRGICQFVPSNVRRTVRSGGGRRREGVLPVGLVEFDFGGGGAAEAEVEHFDEDGEGHGEVDVAFGDVLVEAFGDEHGADQDEEAEGEHLEGGMAVHEVADLVDEYEHDDHGDHDGGDHDADLFDHADGGDDGVEGEDDVEEHDLDDHAAKGGGEGGGFRAVHSFQFFVDFIGAFGEEEEAAEDEDEVFSGDGELVGKDGGSPEGAVEFDDPGEAAKEEDAGDECEGEAGLAGFALLGGGEFAAEDGDEDEVVDAKDDLEDGQRE